MEPLNPMSHHVTPQGGEFSGFVRSCLILIMMLGAAACGRDAPPPAKVKVSNEAGIGIDAASLKFLTIEAAGEASSDGIGRMLPGRITLRPQAQRA